MNVLIVSPYEAVNPHFETELEIAQRHWAAGDTVVMLSCQGEQSMCDFNLTGDRQRCEACRLRRRMGQQLLSARPGVRSMFADLDQWTLPSEVHALLQELPKAGVAGLKRLSVQGFDIGYACLSSLVSSLRDPAPNLPEHRERLEALLKNSWAVFSSVRQYLQSHSVDRVYVFNGRFAEMRAVYRAAAVERVECLIHERGSTHNRFQWFRNHLPHDIDAMRDRMLQFWDQGSEPARSRSAMQWFLDRRQRVERNWKSFTKTQRQNLLPANWDPDRHNVVLFCSSEDEFAAIGDSWDERPYPTQLAGMEHLLSLLSAGRAHLTVRLHPNLKDAPDSLSRPFLEKSDPRLTVVPPESRVDSYALLDQADVCVTYGSSVGIEAVHAGKPSVLLGPCFYRDLGGTLQPLAGFCGDARQLPGNDPRVENLRRWLMNPPAVSDRTGALKYAYWMQENGLEYRYYQGESFNRGEFLGQWVYPRPLSRKWYRRWGQAVGQKLRRPPRPEGIPSGLPGPVCQARDVDSGGEPTREGLAAEANGKDEAESATPSDSRRIAS